MLEGSGTSRMGEEVPSGGMAVVYRAIHDSLNRTVAIKALKTSASAEQQLITRFEREAQSLAALQHENTIHVHDYLHERGAMFIVMEYAQGIALYHLLEKCGRIPYDVAAIIAMQVARALDYIHYRGIIHRDIKPANVMVSRQGGVKVMDFGIARDQTFGDDLTEAGTGIGTPSYMSPEQILGDKLDARSDIFSLGIVLYQMCTGRKPFVEDEEKSVMQKIRLEKYESPRKLNPDIPRDLERIMAKCMHKLPRDRFRSAQDLVMALERFLAKHVEMNYHARLVLLLKTQDIITKLEADEYLNPALGGPAASVLGQQNMAAHQLIRRSVIFQCAVTLVLTFVVGLIHLAPIGKNPRAAPLFDLPPLKGHVRFVAHPWGALQIDGEPVAISPVAHAIEVDAGEHEVVVTNDFYEPIERTIDVRPGSEALEISVDFERDGERK